ncbi:MAG: Fic family protein [Coriobacteriales bacterium]|jgi:Fic family protein|nr:Fic family protein [Coriobacteriales bacterium]
MGYEPFPSFAEWGTVFDPRLVNRYAERLKRAKAAATADAQERALEIATRYAAVDTGALEGLYTTDRGFTRTVATQSEFWEKALATKGEQARRSIEDALSAYDYILDAATKAIPVTQAWIRELHAILTAHQETYTVHSFLKNQLQTRQASLPHGEYRQFPNNPTNVTTGKPHGYAPPESTQMEMTRFVDELQSEDFLTAHPVVQAAYAHYAYVCIHPFADGNGRVARALASVYLYRTPGVPLVVFADQRDRYIDTLEAADKGGHEAFVAFIAERVIDAIGLVEQSMGSAGNAARDALEQLHGAQDSEPTQELLLAAARLREAAMAILRQTVEDFAFPSWVQAAVNRYVSVSEIMPDGYGVGDTDSGFDLNGRVSPHISDTLWWPFAIGISTGSERPNLLVASNMTDIVLDAWTREIAPVVTTALNLRIDAWAQGVVEAFACALAEANRKS